MRLHVQEIGAAEGPVERRDDQAVARALLKIRVVAWTVILAIAAFQAYGQRYAVSPDGISYLDLSDAVVRGRWADLVNLYWSPLYPLLIGLARRIIGAGAAIEVPVAHAVDFAAFVGLIGAYEYFVLPLLALADRTPRALLRGARGRIVAYALFGFMALTMTPLELTTPDHLAGAAVLVALGALLRLDVGGASSLIATPIAESATDRRRRTLRAAIVLGASLGVGALAKSFMVPWAFVCLATLAVARRGRGWSATVVAALVFAALAGPWCAMLSARAGRLTFGDAGRLTYAWFVNAQDPPSLGGVPPGARTAASDAILAGVGITGDASGTDPMWLDPLRWNTIVKPHWDLGQQLANLRVFEIFYLQQFTPLLFLICLIVVAPSGTRRRVWSAGWIVFVPALAGMGAYALVIATARYIMPFVLAITLAILAATPLARRFSPLLALLALAIPAVLESLDPHTVIGLGVVAAVLGAVLAGVLVPARHGMLWFIAVAFAALAAHVVLTPLGAELLPYPVLALVALYWLLARGAVRGGRSASFARRSEAAIAVVLGFIFAIRFENRLSVDRLAFVRAKSPVWGNVSLRIADTLAARGVEPQTRVAVVGPHAEAYWARTGRLHIVADVPRPIADRFWELPAAAQDSLLDQFAAAGATYVIASMPPADSARADSRWAPLPFNGLLRRLDR